MDLSLLLKALIMGIVEGLTEFLPVSSTGHLIVASKLIQFPQDIEATFVIFIQLGAILAVVVYFARDLISLLQRARRENSARRLFLNVLIAFIPAAVVGLLFDDWIEANLFSPVTVAVALIVGGIAMLLVESRPERMGAAVSDVERVSRTQALMVGIAQIASLFPGISRAAATIVGGVLSGMDRPTALRFSFYLSIPTLAAASLYSLAKSLNEIESSVIPAFLVGLVTSFVVALIVIKFFLGYVARHDLKLFAWYRIGAGMMLIGLALAGFFT